MLVLPIKDAAGQDAGTCEVDPDAISPAVSRQLLHDAVVMYEANQRVGTFRTKSRGEVQGTTQKMYRQKGTGRARAGSRRSPVRVGGGHTFAKRPRDFSFRLNRKALRLATRMALRSKFEDDQVVVLNELDLAAPSTREFAAIIKSLGLTNDSVLVALDEHRQNTWLSARNLSNVWMAPVHELNAYSVLHQRMLLIVKPALDQLTQPAEAAVAEAT